MSGGPVTAERSDLPPIDLELLRPALEAAVNVARSRQQARPPLPVPNRLRPLLRFRTLSGRALETVRRAVESDETFRLAVAAALDTDAVGPIGTLWIRRPGGWDARLHEVVAVHHESIETADSADRRRRREAEREVDRLRSSLGASEVRLAGQESDLAQARRDLEGAAAALAAVTEDRDRLIAERQRAVRELKATEKRLAERTAEAHALRADAAATRATPSGAVPTPPAARPVDRDAARHLTAALAATLAESARRVDELEALLGAPGAPSPDGDGSGSGDGVTLRPATTTGSSDAGPGSGRATSTVRPASSAQRRPISLPGGVLDSGAEAAVALAATPGVVFVVDGYNTSHVCWSTEDPRTQRSRLEQALARVSARTRARFEIVYDGVGAGERPPRSTRSLGVHTRFAADDTEADDVVVELADSLADLVPIVVVSTDRRVRIAATRKRIRSISSEQLTSLY